MNHKTQSNKIELKIGKTIISDKKAAFIVAEAGNNHDGNLKQAFQLIDAAVLAKADAVKFQIFKADKLYPPNVRFIDLNNEKLDLFGFLKKSEVNYTWVPKLKTYCDEKGIIFLATPFDRKSADILEQVGVSAYKVASPELNHIPLLKHIAKKGKPMFLSCGLSDLSDIDLAIKTIRAEKNNQIAILHCLSAYPAPAKEYNLNFIRTLIKVFGVIAGLSDHTTDPALLPTLAVANGARIIEKHLTLNRKLKGADHFFALEPKELKLMVEKIRHVEKYAEDKKREYISKYENIMGSYEKTIAPCERKIYPGDKRSIFSVKAIKKGEKISMKNIDVLRAERFLTPGLHPQYFDLILGKTSKKNVPIYRGIQWDDILD